MAAPRLRAYNQAGTALLQTITFSDVPKGEVSSTQTFRLVNDDSQVSVDTATEVRLTVRQVDQVTGDAVLRGLRAVDERWIEMRGNGVGNSNSIITPWTPVGRARYLLLPQLAAGEYHEIEIRYAPPASAPSGEIEFKLEGEALGRLNALEQGHTESTKDGVISGVGDQSFSELVLGAAPTANGPPDDKINVPDLLFIVAGRPRVKLAHSLTLNDQDASAQTIGVGEAYWATISLAADGSLTVTKSDKGTAPLGTGTIPDAPAGEILYTVVNRLQSGIDSAQIDYRAIQARFEYVGATGLNVTLGKGWARVDNSLINTQVETPLTMTANSTNRIWAVSDSTGQFEVTTTATPPATRAYLLYEVTTDGSGVTAVVDKREYIGPELVRVEWSIAGGLSAGDAIALYPGRRPGYVPGPRSLLVAIGDNGSGNATGQTRFEVSRSDEAGGWQTLFSSKATDDRRPVISYNATEPVLEEYLEGGGRILMEELQIPAMSRLRLQTDQPVAYNGTAPSDARAVLLIEVGDGS